MKEFERFQKSVQGENIPEQVNRALGMIAELRGRLMPTGNVGDESDKLAQIEADLRAGKLKPNQAVERARAMLDSRNEP